MEKKLRPYHGLILFAIFLLFMPTIGALLQAKMGLVGVAVSEFCLLVLAILFPRAIGVELKTVFNLTPPPVSAFIGAAGVVFGVLLGTTAIDMVTAYLLPGAQASSDSLSKLISSSTPVVAIIVVAVLPAICEEMLFRGAIMSSFRSRFPALTVIIVGVLFGIGHFDLYRILPTGLLGGALAYVAIATGSIFLPMLFHFIINILSVISAFAPVSEGATDLTEYTPFAVYGSALVYFSLGLFLIFLGRGIVKRKRPRGGAFLACGSIAALLFIAGLGMTALGADFSPAQALASMLFYTALAVAILFVGYLIIERIKPKSFVMAGIGAICLLCFAAGTAVMLVSLPEPLVSQTVTLTAKDSFYEQTVTVTEEGEYRFLVSASAAGGTVKVSLIALNEDGSETTVPETSEIDAQTDAGTNAAPSSPGGEYLATFEGKYIPSSLRQLTLTEGSYVIRVTLTKEENAKDSDVYARAVISLAYLTAAYS